MNAMQSIGNNKISDHVEVDETIVGGQQEGVVGRKNKKKKIIVFAIQRKEKGVARLYGKVISKSSSKELGSFMKANIDLNANVKTG